jgi:pSer/pThr/pTyr-binding forkhead associated (FHA) protein
MFTEDVTRTVEMAKAKAQARPDLNRAPGDANQSSRLVLQVEAPRKRVFQVPLRDTFIIGRMSQEDTSQPDIDLTSADAASAGVSRLHARISIRDALMYIEDMSSTNGTRINGVELTPGKSYRLTYSDEIEVGTMRLSARIVQG